MRPVKTKGKLIFEEEELETAPFNKYRLSFDTQEVDNKERELKAKMEEADKVYENNMMTELKRVNHNYYTRLDKESEEEEYNFVTTPVKEYQMYEEVKGSAKENILAALMLRGETVIDLTYLGCILVTFFYLISVALKTGAVEYCSEIPVFNRTIECLIDYPDTYLHYAYYQYHLLALILPYYCGYFLYSYGWPTYILNLGCGQGVLALFTLIFTTFSQQHVLRAGSFLKYKMACKTWPLYLINPYWAVANVVRRIFRSCLESTTTGRGRMKTAILQSGKARRLLKAYFRKGSSVNSKTSLKKE